MAARIGLSTGREWIVEETADEVASQMMRSNDPFSFESRGKRVYIFLAHVAYVEDESERVYEER